jgi:hypothetical protein
VVDRHDTAIKNPGDSVQDNSTVQAASAVQVAALQNIPPGKLKVKLKNCFAPAT